MSIYGVDLGTFKTTIATVVNPNVEIILNGSSSRSTPTVVGFTADRRLFGESALERTPNFKNTASSLLRLIGRSFHDPEIKLEQQFVTAPLVDVDGEVGVQVRYLNETRRFNATQLMAMFLTHVKRIIEQNARNSTDAKSVAEGTLVLTCPSWFQDSQRRRLQDAARIAGWKRATVVNDTAAVSFAHGFQLYKSLPTPEPMNEDGTAPVRPPPRRIAYVDFGHSTLVCYVVEYTKVCGEERPKLEISIKSTASDRNLGGRDYDRLIVEHFTKQFEGKFEPGALRQSVKAQSRLLASANKLRKILSVNSSAPFNVECVLDEKDVSGIMTRSEFDELIEPTLSRVENVLARALEMANLKTEDIESIELIGGTSRTPAVKNLISTFFKKDLSFTLNMEETAARGAAYYSASISPIVKSIPIAVCDVLPYPIRFVWDSTADLPDKDDKLDVYGAGGPYPASKVVTVYRKQDFSFKVEYVSSDKGPRPVAGLKSFLAQYQITGVKPPADRNEFVTCKLRVKVDEHGIFSISEAYALDENNLEETSPDGEDEATTGDNKPRKSKKHPRKEPLAITATTQSLSESELQTERATEKHMDDVDCAAVELDNLRNGFEEAILKFGSFVSDSNTIPETEKEHLSAFLRENEDWLYDYDGDNLRQDILARMEVVRAKRQQYETPSETASDRMADVNQ